MAQVSEIKIEIIESGVAGDATRPPLLFVHGAYTGAWCWQPHFLPYFAELGHACAALSLRGHGGSDGGERIAAWCVADYVQDVTLAAAQLRERYGRPPVLVGYSMGGYLALMHARDMPVSGLALLATVPPEGLIGSALHLFWRHPQLLMELNLIQHGCRPARLDKLRELLFSTALPDEKLIAYASQFRPESDRALLEMTLPQWDMRGPQGHPPALVLGSLDDVLIPAHLNHCAARFLDVRAQMIAGVGHLMMLDSGWRTAADALAAWLEELP